MNARYDIRFRRLSTTSRFIARQAARHHEAAQRGDRDPIAVDTFASLRLMAPPADADADVLRDFFANL